MKKILKKSGITLIALVVTILILVILAGVTIATLKNTNLFNNAIKAKEKNDYAAAKEAMELKLSAINADYEMNGNGESKLQFAADRLDPSVDSDILYVHTEREKEASVKGIKLGANVKKIYTKLEKYKDYEFGINSNIEIASINGKDVKTPEEKVNSIVQAWKKENSNGNNKTLGEALDESVKDGEIDQYTAYGQNYIIATGGYKVTVDNQGNNISKAEKMASDEKLIEANEMNAYEISKKLKDNLGAYVNYTGNDSINSVKWRIFNVTDDNKIQIIADNYVPSGYTPDMSNKNKGAYDVCCGADDRTIMLNWLNNKQNWTSFVNSFAESAKGGPTAQETIKSYNTYCGEEKLFVTKTDSAFYVSDKPNATDYNSNSGVISGSLYVSETNYNKAFGCWLSSESDNDTFRISYSGAFYYNGQFIYSYGIRPLVTLKPETILEKTGQKTTNDGVDYETYNIKQ